MMIHLIWISVNKTIRFVATSQMGMGFLIFLPMWLFNLRERPAGSIGEFGQCILHPYLLMCALLVRNRYFTL